jgi:hypothetical protein
MAMNNLTSHRRPPIIGVWVDQSIGEQGAYLQIKQCLRELSPFIEEWHFFENPQVFYEFLDDNPKNQIFLIMSGTMAQRIVPAKHAYVNIHSMYVFCQNVNLHRRLKSQFHKVKDVMNMENDLYVKIADELSLLLVDIGESYVESQERGLAQNYLDDALRLMHNALGMDDNHGRIRRVKDLFVRLETWNEDVLFS